MVLDIISLSITVIGNTVLFLMIRSELDFVKQKEG
jgi:hypothetical protein